MAQRPPSTMTLTWKRSPDHLSVTKWGNGPTIQTWTKPASTQEYCALRNVEIVRKDLEAKGMLDQARLFLEATGKQAIQLYKDEIECILRARGYAGFFCLMFTITQAKERPSSVCWIRFGIRSD